MMATMPKPALRFPTPIRETEPNMIGADGASASFGKPFEWSLRPMPRF